MPVLSILILTYNSGGHINAFLNSLKDQIGNKLQDGLYELIIVDNNSSDDTTSLIQEFIKDLQNVKLIQNSDNSGYAKGINLASKNAKGEFLLVINPDSKLVNEDFDKAVEFFENNKNVGIAGFELLTDKNGREKSAGNFFNAFTILLYSMGLETISNTRFAPEKIRKVDYVSGGFVMFKKSVFEKLGGFDEDYFMYIEDMDICYRAKKAGFYTYFLPFASIIHKGQGSSSREFAITNIYKGLVIYYRKHGSFIEELYVKNLLSMKAALIIFLGALFGKKDLVLTYRKALETLS